MAKCYYDTGVFGYFLFIGDWDNEYSPKNVESAYTSTFCNEELIYSYIKKGDFSDYGIKISFVQLIDKVISVNALFILDDIKLSEIRQKFIYMMSALAQNGIDLISDFVEFKDKYNKNKLKPPNGMDWLHLAIAELLGCSIFLTTDKGFRYLSKVWSYIGLNKVKRIIILSTDKLEKVDEVLLE